MLKFPPRRERLVEGPRTRDLLAVLGWTDIDLSTYISVRIKAHGIREYGNQRKKSFLPCTLVVSIQNTSLSQRREVVCRARHPIYSVCAIEQ